MIPHQNGTVPVREKLPLLQWPLQKSAKISSVSDQEPAILRELRALGLVPGAKLVIERKTPNASLLVRIDGNNNRSA